MTAGGGGWRGLDVGGEAQQRARDGEGIAAEGGQGWRRATTELATGWPHKALHMWALTNSVSNRTTARWRDLKESTVWTLSRLRNDKGGRQECLYNKCNVDAQN